MRVLITGGGGFIAGWIMKRLLGEGVAVRSLDLSNSPPISMSILGSAATSVEWHAGDIANAQAVEDAAQGCDLVMHLAAILTPACAADPLRGCDILLGGTLNVFEAARKLGHKHVLYMSSAGVYGPDQGRTPEPTTLYGAFKLAGEGVARAYFTDYGIASAGFRPLVVYGPGRESGLTAGPSLACKAAAEGTDYVIPFGGDFRFHLCRGCRRIVHRRDEKEAARRQSLQYSGGSLCGFGICSRGAAPDAIGQDFCSRSKLADCC